MAASITTNEMLEYILKDLDEINESLSKDSNTDESPVNKALKSSLNIDGDAKETDTITTVLHNISSAIISFKDINKDDIDKVIDILNSLTTSLKSI